MNPLHVDVVQWRESRLSKEYVKEMVEAYLRGLASLTAGACLGEAELSESGALREHVRSVTLCDSLHSGEVRTGTPLVVHVHTLDAFGAQTDGVADTTGDGEELAACEVWALPHEEFHGLWESLEFESRLKADTLRFVQTAFELEALGVDERQVACSRVVLLHGPPGTGKTSLCRALAHKLAVRMAHSFPRARLLELNAHGLFSKWFSESGKLVTKLFKRIDDIVDDPRMLAIVLVDEVESLAHARRAALAGLEPSDSIRAVNAVLAALDRLRRRPNALVLATSNVTGAIDVAFVDRADLKRLVPPPGERAAYAIMRGAALELMTRGAVTRDQLFAWRVLADARFAESNGSRASLRLAEVARIAAAARLSARALRRLPFLALALHCPAVASGSTPPLLDFISALRAATDQYLRDEAELNDDVPPAAPAPAMLAPTANGPKTCNGH